METVTTQKSRLCSIPQHCHLSRGGSITVGIIRSDCAWNSGYGERCVSSLADQPMESSSE